MKLFKYSVNLYPKYFYKNINKYPHCDRDICLCISNLNMEDLTSKNYYKKCYTIHNYFKDNKIINNKIDINNIISYYNTKRNES